MTVAPRACRGCLDTLEATVSNPFETIAGRRRIGARTPLFPAVASGKALQAALGREATRIQHPSGE